MTDAKRIERKLDKYLKALFAFLEQHYSVRLSRYRKCCVKPGVLGVTAEIQLQSIAFYNTLTSLMFNNAYVYSDACFNVLQLTELIQSLFCVPHVEVTINTKYHSSFKPFVICYTL